MVSPTAERVHTRSDPAHPQPPGPRGADLLAAARDHVWQNGAHAGTPLADLPTPFLEWVARASWHDDVKTMAAAVLGRRARDAQRRRLWQQLSAGAVDELLHVVLGLHERVDELEDQVAALRAEAAHADR